MTDWEKVAKRRLRLVKQLRAAILAWADSPDGSDPDYVMAEAVEAANRELVREESR